MGFVCVTCGENHDGRPVDWAYTLPDDVWALPEPERSQRAEFGPDLCSFGDRHFIRCVLYVPFTFSNEAFGWGVWVEVSPDTLARYLAVFDRDGSKEPPRQAQLANVITFYPDAESETLAITFGPAADRPTLTTLPGSITSLAKDQHTGIGQERYHDLLHDIGAL